MTVLVTQNGIVSPTTPISAMTCASALAPVVFPLLSLPVCPYCFPLPSPCVLGQQLNVYFLALPQVSIVWL